MVVLARAGLTGDGPAGTKPKTPAAKVRPAPGPTAKRLYVVRAGDTLAVISAAAGVPVARLRELNPQVEPTSLFIGDKIRLR